VEPRSLFRDHSLKNKDGPAVVKTFSRCGPQISEVCVLCNKQARCSIRSSEVVSMCFEM